MLEAATVAMAQICPCCIAQWELGQSLKREVRGPCEGRTSVPASLALM